MQRRSFIQKSVLGLFGFPGLFSGGMRLQNRDLRRKPLPRRVLGRTRERISVIGLGGIVLMNETVSAARKIVGDAIEQGVNYFDVAPSYGDAEAILGSLLKPYRKQVFLACKTKERHRRGAEEELHSSLKRLQTDYIDLYQFHGFTEVRDVNRALRRGGALDAFLKAREEGKIRYIGFSAHSSKAALKAMDSFDFDAILFPVNYVCCLNGFGPAVMRKALEKKVGILGIKALARQPWLSEEFKKDWPKCWYQPISNPVEAYLALRFSMTQPVTAVIPPGDQRLFRRAMEMAHSFTPLTYAEDRRLQFLAEGLTPLFPADRA